jgi:hypothetical protein
MQRAKGRLDWRLSTSSPDNRIVQQKRQTIEDVHRGREANGAEGDDDPKFTIGGGSAIGSRPGSRELTSHWHVNLL